MKQVTSAFNKQDGHPKASLSNKSRLLNKIFVKGQSDSVNKYRRNKRSVHAHGQDNLSTVQSQTATPANVLPQVNL